MATKVSNVLFHRLILQSADGELTGLEPRWGSEEEKHRLIFVFFLPCAVAEHFHKS